MTPWYDGGKNMLGVLSVLAKPFGFLLQILYGVVGHYWLAILILSVAVRGLTYPIYKKQTLSTVGMAEFSKKSEEIRKKYANDKETMNAKLTELQMKEGVNPLAGCLPMLVQTIVLIGLFTLFRDPLKYIVDDKMIFAIHEPFLWIKDLSQPDPWILPILTGVATYFSFSMNKTTSPQQAAGGAGGAMNIMKYVFPVLLVWLAHTYLAAPPIYWFISQIMQIIFSLRLNKLRKDMEAKGGEERKEKTKNKRK